MYLSFYAKDGTDDEVLRGLDAYDAKAPPSEKAANAIAARSVAPAGYKEAFHFDKEAPSTRPRDKALLVALGVDGDVEFHQAVANSMLTVVDFGVTDGRVTMLHAARFLPANNKLAAQAA